MRGRGYFHLAFLASDSAWFDEGAYWADLTLTLILGLNVLTVLGRSNEMMLKVVKASLDRSTSIMEGLELDEALFSGEYFAEDVG